MARVEGNKLKALNILHFLQEESDSEHPVNAAQIIEHLASLGISAERKSVYNDILSLQESGYDIEQKRGRSGGYYMGSRTFELPELKLLVDAVQSSKFLTTKKSLELIEKLETLSNRYDKAALQRNVVVSGRVKTMNESIYYTVDTLHEAIAKNQQISFRYFEWGTDRERHFRDGIYKASPYALIWDNEYYYLVALSQRHGITHYRVDKMASLNLLSEARDLSRLSELDLRNYGKNVFSMYAGEVTSVKMRFHNSLSGVVIDRFGKDSMLIPDGAEYFTLTCSIAVSPSFFGWLSQFGNRAGIVFPKTVKEQHQALLRQALEQYD